MVVFYKHCDILVNISDVESLSVNGAAVIVAHQGGHKDTLVCENADDALTLFFVMSDFIALNPDTRIVTENDWTKLRREIPEVKTTNLKVQMA